MIEFVFVVFWVVFRYSRVAYSGFIYKYLLTTNNQISERTTAASLDTLMQTIKDGLIFIPQLYINTTSNISNYDDIKYNYCQL
jgi:hypothetical protein